MKSIDEEAIGVWVGLDWADEEPAYALRISGSSEIETGDVKLNTGGTAELDQRAATKERRRLGRDRRGTEPGSSAVCADGLRFCVDLPDQPEVLEQLP